MARVLCGTLIGMAGLIILSRWAISQATPMAALISVPAGVVFILWVGSIGEWLVHRYAMHRGGRFPLFRLATDLHHRTHHWVHFPPDRYVHAGPIEYPSVLASGSGKLCRTGWSRALTLASHGAFYSLFAAPLVLGAWAATANVWFTGAAAVTAAVLIFLFIRVHDAVHYPGASRLERFRWFWFLDRHHYIHHIDTGANTNFLLPLGDLLMGTLRRELTRTELARWPTYETARARVFDPKAKDGRSTVGMLRENEPWVGNG